MKLPGFPEHLSDPTRIRIATELMEKELQKLLPSANPAAIGHDVQRWWEQPANFSMSELIDFWDAADSIIGGIKLKSIVMSITAVNYQWSSERLPVKDIVLLSRLSQLNQIKGLGGDISLVKIGQVLDEDKMARAEQLRLVESYSHSPHQDSYKIIAKRATDGKFMAQDGNRRALLALLRDQDEIDAWVYDDNDEQPKDYWVPVSEMLGLVKIYRYNRQNGALTSHLRGLLGYYFQESLAARAAYHYRIAGWNVRGASELAEGLL